MYIQAVTEVIPLLNARGRHAKSIEICRAALLLEPYNETLCRQLMEAYISTGDHDGAVSVYNSLRQQLFTDLGISPGKELYALYRQASKNLNIQTLPIEEVLDYLQETDAAEGAMQCDYDHFKILCHAQARSMMRSGQATHIAVLSVYNPDQELSKRAAERAMEYLGEQIRMNLRRGDIFSRCSTTQYVIMLPQANYENSSMVCRRIIGAFSRRHPHITARIQFAVRPLVPDLYDL